LAVSERKEEVGRWKQGRFDVKARRWDSQGAGHPGKHIFEREGTGQKPVRKGIMG
jgi:hypothetical protein